MTNVAAKPEPVRLDYYGGPRDVLVTPQDEDRFMMNVEHAALACSIGQKFILPFRKQFEERLLPLLAAWLQERQEAFCDAYVTLREGCLLFLVVRASVPYDRKFEEALVDLSMRVARDEDLDRIELQTLALPKVHQRVVESFLDSRMALQFQRAKRT